jgi:hypothetical protein
VSFLVALIAFMVLGSLFRRWDLAAFCIAVGMVMVIGDPVLWCLLMLAWLVLAWRSVRARHGWDVTRQLTRPLNAVTAVWFVLAAASAALVTFPSAPPQPPTTASVSAGPNVYLVLLDGYPRADSLMEYFGFDNSPFLGELEVRGFEVAKQSGGRYPSTVQVVPTMMQMRPLNQLLDDQWDGSNSQHRQLWQLLNRSPVTAAYHEAGYTTISIPPPAPAVDWRSADVVRESPWFSNFEEHLVGNGILRFVIPMQAMQRAGILDSFRYLRESAGRSRRFVFAHIYSPHAPYVFSADGEPAEPCDAECRNHAGPPNPMLGDRLTGQIQYLNRLTLDALDHIIAVDPDATIVLFSDHGLRRDRADMDEWFRTLFAARNQRFADDVDTLDIFSTMLNQVAAP